MALLGIIQGFKASHGSRTIKTHKFKVEITLEGKIPNGFVGGIDYDEPKKEIEKVLSSLEGKYLDDIVGRATNENIAQYVFYQLREIPLHSLTISEGEEQYVRIFSSDINFEDYPAQLHFNKGQSFLLREKPELAIEELDQAIDLKEDFAEAYNLRGRCKKYLGSYDLALQGYLKAIEINPKFGEAYRNLGNAYYYLDELNLMIPAFTKAIKLMPDSALAFNNRGFAYQQLKKWELALVDHNKAIELDPNYEEAYRDRAAVYDVLGKKELAEKDYARAKELRESGNDTFAGIKMYG
ncbi:MAG: tetratricopeptide repeat protein [Nanoarchaeota archaeon]|nr:tetratricopeptide repeat protein [Nanoarchaeota archaeon]